MTRAYNPTLPQLEDLVSHNGQPRRLTPSAPVVRMTYPSEGSDFRLTHVSLWQPSRPILGWVTLKPCQMGSDSYNRIMRWTYANNYGGFLLANIYPLTGPHLADYRKKFKVTESHYQAGARHAADIAKELRIHSLVLIIGALDREQREMLRFWLDLFRHRYSPIHLKCFDVDAGGMPVKIANSGRPPLAADAKVVPWPIKPARKPKPLIRRRPGRPAKSAPAVEMHAP